MQPIPKFLALPFLLTACTFSSPAHPTLEDLSFLERGMQVEQVFEELGEPSDTQSGSPAFTTYVYELESGDSVQLSFYAQANYLDSAYVLNDEGTVLSWLVPSTFSFPPGIRRTLELDHFSGLVAGDTAFFAVYQRVGSPNLTGYFEDGVFSFIYFLRDGSRLGLLAESAYGCISEISYSPESFGPDWTVLSEDTAGKCAGE